MTFLAPAFLYASFAVAAAVVALHFIITRQPRAGILPTARFVPDLPATATARATRPSDLVLMLLRVLLVLAAGAGLAKPVLKPSHRAEARVILMDLSRSVTDSTAVRDSVRSLYRDGDALVLFDSLARVIAAGVADSIRTSGFSRARGGLSAALIAALRAGSALRDRADSIELVIVSPFGAEEIDAATDSVRSLWNGKARLVTVRGAFTDTARGALELRSAATDPLVISVAEARSDPGATALIARSPALDDAEAMSRAIVEWPVNERPRGAIQRPARDTVGGVVSGNALVVAPFERRWSFPADSIRGAEVVARWTDGEPAAIEAATATGCVRSVAIPVTPVGDLVIRTDFIRLVAALSGDCASRTALRPASPAVIAGLGGPGNLVSARAFSPREDVRSGLAPWLIGLALAAAITELFVRRRKSAETSSAPRQTEAEKRAA